MSEGTFELVIEKGVVTGCNGQSKVIDIPEGVTEIGANAFKNCKFIEEVNIKSTILKTIGESAFEDCANMKNCTLLSLKGSIENCAFKGCNALKYIEIPDGTIKIGKGAFSSCESMLYVVIPSTVFVIEGELFDSDNKKTVILGEIGSEAEEYAKSNKMPFKENTPAIRKEFIALSNKKENTGYKDFNVFGETVRCYKSIVVYEEMLAFIRELNVSFMNDVIKCIPKSIIDYDRGFLKLVEVPQKYIGKVREYLEKYGIFINDVTFEEAMVNYNLNYIQVCRVFCDTYCDMYESIINGTAELKDRLVSEAKSKITGLSYCVIGDSVDLIAHAIDDYREVKRQSKEAYKVADMKLAAGTNLIHKEAQAIYVNFVNDTTVPEFEKSVDYIVAGLLKYIISETVKEKVIDSKVFDIYDSAKADKIIKQAQKNVNIDKKYAIATTLKLYPLNVDAVVLAINESLIEKDFLRFIDFFDFYKNDMVILAFENKFSYLELQSFLEKNEDILGDGFKKTIEASIKHKAKILIERINNDGDPMEIDIDTWKDLVQKFTIIDSKNINRYKISENEVKAPNGRELLAKAIEIAKEEKQKADLVKKQKAAEKQKKNNQKNKIKEIENQILKAEKEIEKSKGFGYILLSAVFALAFLIMSIVLIYAAIDYQIDIEEISTVLLILFAIIMFIVMSCITRSNLKDYRQGKEKAKQLKKQIKIWEKDLQLSNDNFENKHKEQEESERLVRLQEQREKEEKQKKIKTISLIVFVIVSALATYFLVMSFIITPNNIYNKAMVFMAENNYDEALEQLNSMEYPCKDSEIKKQECHYFIAKKHEESNDVKQAAISYGKAGNYQDAKEKSMELWNSFLDRTTILASSTIAIGVKVDGTVVAVGKNYDGQCNVSNWSDIIDIDYQSQNTIGLKADGTVIAVGDDVANVFSWNNIVDIVASEYEVLGLKIDGTVISTNNRDSFDVSSWTDIVQIAEGTDYVVGLKADGTVVATGNNDYGQCNVIGWTNVIKVVTGDDATFGLKSDGTIEVAGGNSNVRQNISDWTDIVDISVDDIYGGCVGLKSNGTVVVTGMKENDVKKWDVSGWNDIAEVVVGPDYIVGIKSDRTVVYVGDDDNYGYENIRYWKNIECISCSNFRVVGLKMDGTVVTGEEYDIFDGIDNWKDIAIPK